MHFGLLALMLAATAWGWELLGRPHAVWFWLGVGTPVAHQVYVWLAWRLQLGSGPTAKVLGFRGYVVLFFLLFFGRFATFCGLAWVDRRSLGLPSAVHVGLAVVLAVPALYAAYSTVRYFGMKRAAGADHFEARYREMPLVSEGIFRFTQNGMYGVVFLLFWAIALGLDSSAALLLAAFSHAYIWVHYFATEKPDMEHIYGQRS